MNIDELNFNNASIEKFIFHIVHHGEENPILLDETPLGPYESFFIDRIKETISGNRFLFNDGSLVKDKIVEIYENNDLFVDITKDLARHFQTYKNKNIKPGVVIFIILRIDDEFLFSIIKYDHEEVLSYKLEDGNHTAILHEVKNSFTKSEKALHKSAIIYFKEEDFEIKVIDRKVREDISKFFKGFLSVFRKYNEQELTQKVLTVAINTVKKHKSILPQEITGNVRNIVYQNVKNEDAFEEDQFFSNLFGTYGTEEIRKTYDKFLEKNDLKGESFPFREENLTPPKKYKIHTNEGIDITYDESAKDNISFEEDDDIRKIIIETQKYEQF